MAIIDTRGYRGPDRRRAPQPDDTYPRPDLDPIASAAERIWPHLDGRIRDTTVEAVNQALDDRWEKTASILTATLNVDPRTEEGKAQLAKAAKLMLTVSGAYCEGCSSVRALVGRVAAAWLAIAAGATAAYMTGAFHSISDWIRARL